MISDTLTAALEDGTVSMDEMTNTLEPIIQRSSFSVN